MKNIKIKIANNKWIEAKPFRDNSGVLVSIVTDYTNNLVSTPLGMLTLNIKGEMIFSFIHNARQMRLKLKENEKGEQLPYHEQFFWFNMNGILLAVDACENSEGAVVSILRAIEHQYYPVVKFIVSGNTVRAKITGTIIPAEKGELPFGEEFSEDELLTLCEETCCI